MLSITQTNNNVLVTEIPVIVKVQELPGGSNDPIWNANEIKGIPVDDTNIGGGRVLVYNATTGNLEYRDQGSVTINDFLLLESFRGFNCAGITGATNRTLTLGNLKHTASVLIWVQGAFLYPIADYTIVHNTTHSVITFLNPIDDPMYILVQENYG